MRAWSRMPFTDKLYTSGVQVYAEKAMTRYLTANPTASVEQALDYAERWTKRRTYHDERTNAFIVLPHRDNTPVTQAALSDWLGRIEEAHSKGDAKITPRVRVAEDGTVTLTLEPASGGPAVPWAKVPLNDIVQGYKARTALNPQDNAEDSASSRY